LYAGTGALGLEALSRGAGSADFVENGPAALHALKANVAALRVRERTRIFKRDALAFVERLPERAYDIALADPPYASRQSDRLVRRWLERPFSLVLVIEHASEHALPGNPRVHRYGESALSLYRVSTSPAASPCRARGR
ncbi:MAG: RsmD family RNA methyltransferase, partial [Longimicrobiales bacterium]